MAGRRVMPSATGRAQVSGAGSPPCAPLTGCSGQPDSRGEVIAKQPNLGEFPDIKFSQADLFGDPVDPRHGLPGRPRHMATADNRARVAAMAAANQAQPMIAAALGITVPTLTLHYRAELADSEFIKRLGRPKAARPVVVPRPRHRPTPITRWGVRTMALRGLAQPVIAQALHCSVPTLRAHYAAELGLSLHVQRKTKKKTNG